MNHYVILSKGAWSDYSPVYFCGPVAITQEELDAKAIEFGDAIIAEHPDSDPGNVVREKWWGGMSEWLTAQGYHELPKTIPEVNINYDIPTSKNQN